MPALCEGRATGGILDVIVTFFYCERKRELLNNEVLRSSGREKEIEEEKLIREVNDKISKYRELIDMAYEILDKKFTYKEIELMPHRELLDRIEIQANANRRLEEYRNKASNNKQGWFNAK